MKLHGLHQACAIALFAVAPIVAGQTSGTASGPTGTTSGSNAAAPAQGTMPSHDTSSTHATKPHKHSAHVSGTSTQTMSHGDSPYQAALKRCVEGPANQRDSCIDQAITQYGRT
jgi:hypothetical protein